MRHYARATECERPIVFLIDVFASLAVIVAPGPLLLACFLPRHFAPRGNQWAGLAVYGGLWVAASAWMQISPTFVG